MRTASEGAWQDGSDDPEAKSGTADFSHKSREPYLFAVEARFGGVPVLVSVDFAEKLRTGSWRDTLELEVYEPVPVSADRRR